MTDLLQEFCDSRDMALRVDRSGGVIRGIKVLGPHSRNSRECLPEALARAVGLYEGAKVNVNHPKGHPLAPRDYQERIGIIRNVQHRAGEGLFADFHFNPKHYLSEQLVWDAEHAPENVGFSHNVQARTSRRGETTLVEEILRVHSVDLVADPATTRGLFESTSTTIDAPMIASLPSPFGRGAGGEGAGPVDPPHPNPLPVGEGVCEQLSNPLEKQCREQVEELARLRLELDQLRAKEAAHQRRETVRALLAEYHLPDPASADPSASVIVSDTFLQSLITAPDEPAMRRLIEERSSLIGSAQQWRDESRSTRQRPLSRDQNSFDPQQIRDARSFARAISR